MDDSEKYYWKCKDKKISQLTDMELLQIYLFKLLIPFLTFITAFFPFSQLWQDRRFHYGFKEVIEMDDLIVKIASEKGYWFKFLSFDRDKRYLIIIGKFIAEKKNVKEEDLIKHFEESFAHKNIYISKPDAKTVKFVMSRNKQ